MRKIITTILLVSLICVACKSKSLLQAHTSTATKKPELTATTSSFQDSLINYGKEYLKVPYRYGGTTSNGFDCSGFTSHVYRNFGYDLQRSSRDQAKQFPSVKKNELQVGDLVFFEGRRHNRNVGHVGIVTDTNPNGEFRFIHASVRQGVIVSSSTEAYYASRYLKAGRVAEHTNTAMYAGTNSAKNSSSFAHTDKNPKTQNINDNVYHTVARGDNLSTISKKYDVPISTIQHLNNLTSKRIKRGQKLLITEVVHIPAMSIARANPVDASSSATSKVVTNLKVNNTLYESQNPEITTPDWKQREISPALIPLNSAQSKTHSELQVEGEEPTIQSVSTERMLTHKVKVGESLYSIAGKHNMSIEELKVLNNLTDNSINAGQSLKVKLSNDSDPVDIPSNKLTRSTETAYHKVKQGDTLYSIARMYGCSVNDLRKLNTDLSNTIKVGDKIRVKAL